MISILSSIKQLFDRSATRYAESSIYQNSPSLSSKIFGDPVDYVVQHFRDEVAKQSADAKPGSTFSVQVTFPSSSEVDPMLLLSSIIRCETDDSPEDGLFENGVLTLYFKKQPAEPAAELN